MRNENSANSGMSLDVTPLTSFVVMSACRAQTDASTETENNKKKQQNNNQILASTIAHL